MRQEPSTHGLEVRGVIDLYFCYRQRFAEVASWIGYGVGTRADEYKQNFVYRSGFDDDIDISFVDNDFEDPDRECLLDVAETVNAERVVLPDIFSVEDVSDVLEFGREVKNIGATPIVVPKCDFDYSRIPRDWIVGYSVPSGYGSTDVPIGRFTSHDVHLLGGSPSNQFEFAEKAITEGVSIVSADTNSFGAAASYGNIVNHPKRMADGDGNAWLYDVDEYDDMDGRIIVSLAHYYEAWRLWCDENL